MTPAELDSLITSVRRLTDSVRAAGPAIGSMRCRWARQPVTKGATFTTFVNEEIDRQVSADRTRDSIVMELTRELGADPEMVDAILRGETDCPDIETIHAFARVFGLSTEVLRATAEVDGCDYLET